MLYKTLLWTLFLSLVLTMTANADARRGQQLHDANCISCHNSLMGGNPNQIYTRADRKINNLGDLKAQIRRCKMTDGVPWPEEQINDVVDYLNQTFYKL